jgi:hypothetical protein
VNERVASSQPVDVEAELSVLTEERDFLLSSLRDLDAEHDAGDIDDVDYQTLRDDYTARTAQVLRAMERAKQPPSRPGRRREAAAPTPVSAGALLVDDHGDEDLPAAAAVSAAAAAAAANGRGSKTRWRLVAIVTSVLLFGVIAGWAVTATSGSRQSGQSITGNSNLRNPTPAPTASAVDSSLTKAASLMNSGKVGDALKLYDQILQSTPNQPEAEAYSGWLIAQTGMSVTPARTDLIDAGLTRIEAAEKAAPTYADPHFFRGFLLLNAKNDPSDAVTELRTYLGTVDPSSPEVPDVEAVLKQAIAAAGPNVPPGPYAPTASEAPSTPATASQPASTPTPAAP